MGGGGGRPVVLSGCDGVASGGKRPLLALLEGGDRAVVELAGETRRRRFLTASSKVSQSTSGRWCGRQGEQSPRASGDVVLLLQRGAVGVGRKGLEMLVCRRRGRG